MFNIGLIFEIKNEVIQINMRVNNILIKMYLVLIYFCQLIVFSEVYFWGLLIVNLKFV